MDYVYGILILIIAGMSVWIWKLSNEKREVKLAKREAEDNVELGKGLAEYNQKMQEKKDLAKAKILEIMKAGKISNRDVAKGLLVSSATAVRYLDELEAEGKVKQVGKTGKWVVYSLK